MNSLVVLLGLCGYALAFVEFYKSDAETPADTIVEQEFLSNVPFVGVETTSEGSEGTRFRSFYHALPIFNAFKSGPSRGRRDLHVATGSKIRTGGISIDTGTKIDAHGKIPPFVFTSDTNVVIGKREALDNP